MFKILEKDGVNNENIDGGAFNNLSAGNQDGVLGGVLSECRMTSIGNAISIGTGVIIIHGIRVKIISVENIYISSIPLTSIRYQVIARITIIDSKPDFILFVQEPKNLTQEEFYENNNGVYEIEIGRFTHNPDGSIGDLTRTVDTLYGAAASGSIEVGDVTVREIDAGNPPEVDINKRKENGKELLDFDFGIPKTTATDVEAIHYTEQKLTEAQQNQARENIGAQEYGNYATQTALSSEISARQSADSSLQSAINAKYTKPSTGIPESDLSASVQASLDKADSAFQLPSDVVIGKSSPTITSGTTYINCSHSSTISASGNYYFINCSGTITVEGTWPKVYVTNSPNLTVNGITSSNWRNVYIDGVAKYKARTASISLPSAYSGGYTTVASNRNCIQKLRKCTESLYFSNK